MHPAFMIYGNTSTKVPMALPALGLTIDKSSAAAPSCRDSHLTSTIFTSSPSGCPCSVCCCATCIALLLSSTLMFGTLTSPHSIGMRFHVTLSSAPGRRMGMRPWRRQATTNASDASGSSCTVTFAERVGWRLRIVSRSGMAACRRPVVGASRSAMRPSEGGRRGGREKDIVAWAPWSPSGRTLQTTTREKWE